MVFSVCSRSVCCFSVSSKWSRTHPFLCQKHLNHLKAISQLSQTQGSLGTAESEPRIQDLDTNGDFDQNTADDTSRTLTPLSSRQPSAPFQFSTVVPPQSASFGSVNPMVGLGVGDEQQYATMLANLTGDLFSDSAPARSGMKRPAENVDAGGEPMDEHQAKRGRFDVGE